MNCFIDNTGKSFKSYLAHNMIKEINNVSSQDKGNINYGRVESFL